MSRRRKSRCYVKDEAITVILAVLAMAVVIAWQSCGYLVPEDKIIRGIEKRGYSEVKITSKSVFFMGCKGCGTTDAVRFDASALNPKGDRVTLYACAGWPFKGVTIRTE